MRTHHSRSVCHIAQVSRREDNHGYTTSGDALTRELIVIVIVFTIMTISTLVVWCLFGIAIRTFLSSERQRRIVNWSMAGALVLSVFMLFV